MNDRRHETVTRSRYGFAWGWLSRSGKRVWLRVTRMVRVDGRGAVLGIDTGDPDRSPRLEVYVSDGGRKMRVWLDDIELVPREADDE